MDKEYHISETDNIKQIIFKEKIVEKDLTNLTKTLNLTWNELIYLLEDNIVNIIKPNEYEKRYLWFEENQIEFLLKKLFKINEWKNNFLNQIIENIDFSNFSGDEFNNFLNGWYKTYLINEIAKELKKISTNSINEIGIEAASRMLYRKKFNNTTINLSKIIISLLDKHNLDYLNNSLSKKLWNYLIKEKDIFLSDSMDYFYNNFFSKQILKSKDSLKIMELHIHMIPLYKKITIEYFKKNIHSEIDNKLITSIINNLIKKEEVLKIYELLVNIFLNEIKIWTLNIVYKYLNNIYTTNNFFAKWKKYISPNFKIKWITWNISQILSSIKKKLILRNSEKNILDKNLKRLEQYKKRKILLNNKLTELIFKKNNLLDIKEEVKKDIYKIKQDIKKILEIEYKEKKIYEIINFIKNNNNLEKIETLKNNQKKKKIELWTVEYNIKNINSEIITISHNKKEISNTINSLEKKIEELKENIESIEIEYKNIKLEFIKNLMKRTKVSKQ